MAGCPHGANSTPERCSQCIGVRPRMVRSDERGVAIDGDFVRDSMLETGLRAAPQERRTRGRPRTVHQAASTEPALALASFAPGAPGEHPHPEAAIEQQLEMESDLQHEEANTHVNAAVSAESVIEAPSIAPVAEPAPAAGVTPPRRVAARQPAARAIRPIVTARQLKTAHSIIDYAETHGTLAFPTPAGRDAVALLDCALDFAGTDREIHELHRLGLIQLVSLGEAPGLEHSLRSRGHSRNSEDRLIIDGVAYDGVRVIATPTPARDALEVAELVWMAHDKPMSDFVDRAWQLARGTGSEADGARLYLCGEWDRIRGVLPAVSAKASAASDDDLLTVAPLLRQACESLSSPPAAGVGRPRLPVAETTFAVVVMAGLRVSSRKAAAELARLQEHGIIERGAHYNSLTRAFHDPAVAGALERLVEATAGMVGAPVLAPIAVESRAATPQARGIEEMAATVYRNLRLVAGARRDRSRHPYRRRGARAAPDRA